MTLDDWILALHVLSAFALVAAVVLFWVLVLAGRRVAEDGRARLEPVSKIGAVAIGVGSLGTLVFGVWLAISIDRYALWDLWIVAALVLWVIGVGTGQRAGVAFGRGDESDGIRLHAISSVAVLLILVDMIWKPGA